MRVPFVALGFDVDGRRFRRVHRLRVLLKGPLFHVKAPCSISVEVAPGDDVLKCPNPFPGSSFISLALRRKTRRRFSGYLLGDLIRVKLPQ